MKPEKLYPGADWAQIPGELKDLLPRHKGDDNRVDEILRAGYPRVQPLLPLLLTWLQDMNWPIAGRLAVFLKKTGRPLEKPVREILRGDDDMWKYWILTRVVENGDPALGKALERDLEKLMKTERSEDVRNAAAGILKALKNKKPGCS